jgi:protein TonB
MSTLGLSAPKAAVDRRLMAVLSCSLAAHAVALLAVHLPARPSVSMPLLASLRVSIPATRSAEAGRVESVPQRSITAVAAPAAMAPRPARNRVLAVDRPAQSVVAATAIPVAAAVMPPVQPAAVAEAVHVPVAVAAPPVPRPASDALAAYRRQLTELFAARHDYPRIAALRGWEGEVRLRLKVARKGNLLGIALDRSSGFDVLDQHALALLEGHGNLPPLPDALEAGEIQVVVPINYKLRKTT